MLNLTEREVLILKHLVALHIQELESTTGNAIKELRKILEKINVQLKQRS